MISRRIFYKLIGFTRATMNVLKDFHLRYLVVLFFALVVGFFAWQGTKSRDVTLNSEQTSKTRLGAPLYDHFGTYHKPIATNSPLAQRYFTQGLLLYYGLNSLESIRSFREAIRLDPQCAMCYWGLALALGSKANASAHTHDRREVLDALRQAQKLAAQGSSLDRAYIEALAKRYEGKHDLKGYWQNSVKYDCVMCRGRSNASPEELRNYANAMGEVVDAFPNDIDAKNLYVAALLDAADWNLYSKDKVPSDDAQIIIATLDDAIRIDPTHVATHHYYIHAFASSATPEKALPSADYLRTIRPLMRQFSHAPSHIYLLTGRYHDATVANQRAIAAYKEYIGESWAQGFEPKKNYLFLHDLHCLCLSATFQGRSHLALETAEELVRQTPVDLAKGGEFEMFYAIPYFTKTQFGLWQEILDEPMPANDRRYQQAMLHYARGMAYVRLGRTEDAEVEFKSLRMLSEDAQNNEKLNKLSKLHLQIALVVLESQIFKNYGLHQQMYDAWAHAVELEEKWDDHSIPIWHFPLREGLADAYMTMQQPERAEIEYVKVLKKYPENGWTLFALSKSLSAQKKYKEAFAIEDRFKKSWARADITFPTNW